MKKQTTDKTIVDSAGGGVGVEVVESSAEATDIATVAVDSKDGDIES